MSRFRPKWFVLLLLLLFCTAEVPALATWQCEGQPCGTAWGCCCVQPPAVQDSNCGSSVATSSTRGASVCPSDCNCVQTVQSLDAARATGPRFHLALVTHAALLPAAPLVLEPLPTERVARADHRRGPPPRCVALATPSLRGPPVLTSLQIGS